MVLDIRFYYPYAITREACEKIKKDPYVQASFARILQKELPKEGKFLLLPMPSHTGHPSYTSGVACHMEATNRNSNVEIVVFHEITCEPRESLYVLKRAGGQLPDAIEFHIDAAGRRSIDALVSQGYQPVVIDNVIDSGRTALAVQKAVGHPCWFMCLGLTGHYNIHTHEYTPDKSNYRKA